MISDFDPEIKKLRAVQWQQMDQTTEDRGNDPLAIRVGASMTSDVGLLRTEADMVSDDGYSVDNPHIPIDRKTLAEATEAIKQDGNTPAWEQ